MHRSLPRVRIALQRIRVVLPGDHARCPHDASSDQSARSPGLTCSSDCHGFVGSDHERERLTTRASYVTGKSRVLAASCYVLTSICRVTSHATAPNDVGDEAVVRVALPFLRG